jgi:thiosulfate dehydrogenase [quinone] large subunit
MKSQTCCNCVDPKSLAPALIRWALGLLFLVGGIGKLMNLGGFVNGYLLPAFEKTVLPGGLVAAYGYALPFVEVLLGVLLILGLCRTCALALTGVTLISLGFGQILLRQHGTVANIYLYVLMTALALWMGEHDRWTLDGCLRSRPCTEPGAA